MEIYISSVFYSSHLNGELANTKRKSAYVSGLNYFYSRIVDNNVRNSAHNFDKAWMYVTWCEQILTMTYNCHLIKKKF